MKKLLTIILLCGLLSSCMTDVNLKDVNTDISLNPALALPIGNVHAHIIDLISFVDSTYIKTDSCNGIYAYFSHNQEQMSFPIDEFRHGETLDETLTLSTIPVLHDIFQVMNQIGIESAPLPQGQYPFRKETLYHFGFNEYIEGEKDIHINSAIINHAEINFNVEVEGIELDENTYLELSFHFPDLLDEEYANKFENIKITENKYPYHDEMEHFMAHFNITEANSNAVDLVVDFKIVSDGTKEINRNAKIKFQTDIRFMNFDEVYGHLWQKEPYSEENITFEIPKEIFDNDILNNNKLLFSNPSIDIDLHSNIGVPLLICVNKIHYTKDGIFHTLDCKDKCKFEMEQPNWDGEIHLTKFRFDKTNSPITELLNAFPEKIELEWEVYANDSVREHIHYFLNPIIAEMDFNFTLPFQFDPTTHISYKDTIAADLEETLSTITDVVNIDTLSLYLDIASSLPASATIKLCYLDENNNLLFESKEFAVEAAEVDGEGRVLNPTIQNKEIGFSSNLAKEIISTKNIVFEIALTTRDNNSKLYIQSTDKIDINLSAYAKAKINLTTNSQE